MNKYEKIKMIIEKVKKINTFDKINYLIIIIFSALFIVEGIFNFYNDKLSTDQLLSYVLFALGFTCFQDFLGKFNLLHDIKINVDYLKENVRKDNTVHLSTREEIEKEQSLIERLSDAKEVKMLSYANTSFFSPMYLPSIIKSIDEEKTTYKLIGVDPNSKFIENIKKHKMKYNQKSNPMKTSYDEFVNIKEKYGYDDNKITYKTIDVDLPFHLLIVEKKSGEITVKVDIISLDTPDNDRRCISISSFDPSVKGLIAFFLKQWDNAWNMNNNS